MFTPKLNTSRPRSSPFGNTGKGSVSKSRRNVSLYGSQNRTSYGGRGQAANRSLLQASHIVEETPLHRLEEYGGALPVLVRESLIMYDKNQDITVRLDPSGWARLVCGRRLFVWRYKDSHLGKCYELSLPPSDLSHQAELVAVLVHPSDPLTAACVAASPEGVVRYWSTVSHEGSFVEISVDLKGEEAAILMGLQSFQCVLATTTSTLTLLLPSPGQNQISSRTLRTSSGMFSGIGRRMSSFIFGSSTTQSLVSTLHQVLPGEVTADNTHTFYVLSSSSLQKIALTDNSDKVLYQCDVDQFLRPCLAETIWNQDVVNLPNLRTWLIDMQSTRDGVVILGAGMNPDVSQEIHYVFGILHTEGNDPPQSFLSFTVSKFTNVYQDDDYSAVLKYKLLLPDPTTSSIYMYDTSSVICLSVSSSNQPLDKVEFMNQGDQLLGAGHYEGQALFFSLAHGLVTIIKVPQLSATSDVTMAETSMINESFAAQHESFLGHVTLDRVNELSMSEDKTARLKAAFLHSCRGNVSQASAIVEELFPSDVPMPSEPDSGLDVLVSLLSQEMVDDYPASDPRWAESVPQDGVSSSVSLILLHQLEDKLKAHEVFTTFLSNVNLWPRLHTRRVRGGVMPTRMLLCEHAEKITAAMTLRALHTQHPQLIDKAIREVLDLRQEAVPPSGLTPQDVFYRQVSNIDEILTILAELEQEEISSNVTPRELVSRISTINTVVISMLHDACQYRQSKSLVYQPNPRGESEPEYIPWTASTMSKERSRSTQSQGIRALLTKQHSLTVNHALNAAQDASERGALLQQLLELTDLLLDGYRNQLQWIRQAVGETPQYMKIVNHYEQQRSELISPFMEMEQYERAASLAEKYCDFAILVQLCENTNNDERLQRYMNQFQNRGFSDFVFKWYMEAGKRGKLMSSSLANHPQLSRFLHQGDNAFLSWVHDINSGDFSKAHQTLMDLAVKETESVAKKKTLMSFSKLTALASDNPPPDVHNRIEAINDGHDLILHQEMLPASVVEGLGLQLDNMKVFTPKELIELYISEMNDKANEFDFKKALDLLRYVDKEDTEIDINAILMAVWCKAILRDRWDDIPSENPLEYSKDTVFFKTVELAYTEGMDLREYLPPAEQILDAEELGDLRDNATFQYLVKAGYEQISRILA